MFNIKDKKMNNKKMIMDINTTLVDADDINEFEMSVIGDYKKDKDKYIIEYIESSLENSRTTITFGDTVDILRKGAYVSHFVLELNQRRQNLYQTPFGNAVVAVTAEEIDCNLDDSGGKAQLKYALDIDGRVSSFYELDINIRDIEN
jgi:uncharacterized beta-barrel protein YwiB (DUF1934 family)